MPPRMSPRKDASRISMPPKEDFNPALWEADPDVEVKLRACSQQVPLGLKIDGGHGGAVFIEGVEPGLWASRQGLQVPCEIISLSTKTHGLVNVKQLSEKDFVNMMMTRPLTFTFGALRLRRQQRERSRSRSKERRDVSEAVQFDPLTMEEQTLEGDCWGVTTSMTIRRGSANEVDGFGSNMYEDFSIKGTGTLGEFMLLTATNSCGNFSLEIRWHAELQKYIGKTLDQGHEGLECSFELLQAASPGTPVLVRMPSPVGSFRKRVTSVDTAALLKALTSVSRGGKALQDGASHDELALNRRRVMQELVTEGLLQPQRIG